jgi:hypothetical protein
MSTLSEALVEVLAEHRYRDVLGDYDTAPFYRHFGCSCGWEQNIEGMSGWRSWVATHNEHVAGILESILAPTPAPESCRWTNGGAPACSETRDERYWCEPCRERREVGA